MLKWILCVVIRVAAATAIAHANIQIAVWAKFYTAAVVVRVRLVYNKQNKFTIRKCFIGVVWIAFVAGNNCGGICFAGIIHI